MFKQWGNLTKWAVLHRTTGDDGESTLTVVLVFTDSFATTTTVMRAVGLSSFRGPPKNVGFPFGVLPKPHQAQKTEPRERGKRPYPPIRLEASLARFDAWAEPATSSGRTRRKVSVKRRDGVARDWTIGQPFA